MSTAQPFKFVANPPRPASATGSSQEFIRPQECEVHLCEGGSQITVPNTGRNYAVIIMPCLTQPRAFSKVMSNGLRLAEISRIQGKNPNAPEGQQWGFAFMSLNNHLGEKLEIGRCTCEAQVNIFVDPADYPETPASGTSVTKAAPKTETSAGASSGSAEDASLTEIAKK